MRPNKKPTYEELEQDVKWYRFNSKIGEWIWSILVMVVMLLLFQLFVVLANAGLTSVSITAHYSQLTITILGALTTVGAIVIDLYIVWHFLVVTIYTFDDEIRQASKKASIALKIFIRGASTGIRKEIERYEQENAELTPATDVKPDDQTTKEQTAENPDRST